MRRCGKCGGKIPLGLMVEGYRKQIGSSSRAMHKKKGGCV